MLVEIEAIELETGPTGFPWVNYNVRYHRGGCQYEHWAATPDHTLAVLQEDCGLTENQARRAMHDARDHGRIVHDVENARSSPEEWRW